MNIYDYIDNYGIYSFEEKEINLVDKVIFSFLSYANFNDIVKRDKITIQDAGRIHVGMHKKNEVNVIAVAEAHKLLRHLMDTKRYKDCLLYNYINERNQDLQFGVLCIEYLKNKVYVSFEGTDDSIVGWKENFVLSYRTNTISHKKAIKYINMNFTLSNKEIIIGGHSKGGNLALIAGMYSNFLVKRQIKEVLNVDGPGLQDEEFYSDKFNSIIKKYKHIVPDNSIIGMLLNSTNETVIKTTAKGPITHDIAFWKIKDNQFEITTLSPYSKELRKDILDWVHTTHKNDLRKFTNNFANICAAAGVDSLLDIKNKKRLIITLIQESKNMDEEAKRTLINFLKMVAKSYKDTQVTLVKNKIKDIKEKID